MNSSNVASDYFHRRLGSFARSGWMDHEAARSVKAPPFISNGQDTISNVDKLRGYYDGARNRLKSYLAMGSGSSSPRILDDVYGGGGADTVGGVMFQQRPAHCRLEGKQVLTGEEFTDISYSDLGFIITPQSKKLPLNNNNYETPGLEAAADVDPGSSTSPTPSATTESSADADLDIDVVSTELGNGGNSSSTISSNSSCNNIPSMTMQHRGSTSSFTLPGSTDEDLQDAGDLRLEEVMS
ncbi:uncharacterized protein LOC125032922 isoform X2 [Penaeus chinensis]|uniref:uncharacterized protein LOC125032922 isoform X2 n=1 Tax=Penaeus chinensis TaxID=139456 RepID=UPI001FB5BD7F|nr:uncharacterized protein LOC125032922 isoform X2 [Penaeus chinensis]